MDIFSLSLLIIFLLLLFIFMGVQIWAALSVVGIGGFVVLLPYMQDIVGNLLYTKAASVTMSAIPIFLFMGEIMAKGGLSKSLYRALKKITNWLPGGIIHCNVLTCAIFAAISGSSIATVSTFGAIAYDEQRELGYPPMLISGSLAASGTLGILIPPSATMLIYAAMTENSASKLFMAGIVPGIVLALMFMGYIFFYSIVNKGSFKNIRQGSSLQFKDLPQFFADILPFTLIILSIIVGIYSGIMTPTEAAGIAAVEALVITFFYGKLTYSIIKESAISALETSAMMMLIFIGANIFGSFISMLKLPANICLFVESLQLSRYAVLGVVSLLYFILGCVMSILSAIVITLPVTYPLMMSAGFDPIWFGIYAVLINQIGLLTPPVALNTYIIHEISKEKNLGKTFKSVMPFAYIIIFFIIIITIFPNLVTFVVRGR